ncbi:MAG: GNAT family N-acetyltransferase [Candidatus Hodarchaeales archaeon]|jgi:GNAT superfamily N-acetyltransferase
MKILEYDEVDPIEVLHLNLLGLNFSLTPERVKLTRHHDSRPFPFFALYAVVEGVVAGQVGVFRLPMTTIEGPEDVGGVWAVLTNPSFKRRGIASRLLEEAHERMSTDGLRFSTLGTSRFRVAHLLYAKHGYQDVFFSPSLLFQSSSIKKEHKSLKVEQADPDQLHLADELFQQVSLNHYGFSKRFEPFMSAMVAIGEISVGPIEKNDIWFLWKDNRLVGYFIAKFSGSILQVIDMLLATEINVAEAISSLVTKLPANFVQIRSTRDTVTKSLMKNCDYVIPQDWGTFMIKPLTPKVEKADLKDLFGINTDRFLFSWLDST